MYTRELSNEVHNRLDHVNEEITALQRLQRSLGADVERQKGELEPARDQLAELLVPDLSPATLTAVSTRQRLPALAPAAVAQRRGQILHEAQQRLAKLLADERVITAEAVLNEVEIRVGELETAIAPLLTATTTLEAEAMFLELLQWRYGTDEYTVKFWQLAYYRHWKHGDLIVEAHGERLKVTDFKQLAAKYVEEKTALATLQQTREGWLDKKRAIQALQRQVRETQATITDIDDVMLKNARSRVKDHLRQLDDADVFALLRGDDAAELAFKRVVGIGKKQEYLKALGDEQIKVSLGELHQIKNKLQRTQAKLARPKYSHTHWQPAVAERMLGKDRREKWQKRRASWNDTRTHVVEFHHYDRWDPVRDVLWWDVMTDGRLDGNFISEVRERGPSTYQHQHDGGQVQPAWRNDDLGDIS